MFSCGLCPKPPHTPQLSPGLQPDSFLPHLIPHNPASPLPCKSSGLLLQSHTGSVGWQATPPLPWTPHLVCAWAQLGKTRWACQHHSIISTHCEPGTYFPASILFSLLVFTVSPVKYPCHVCSFQPLESMPYLPLLFRCLQGQNKVQ
jgi:hypothetical protein